MGSNKSVQGGFRHKKTPLTYSTLIRNKLLLGKSFCWGSVALSFIRYRVPCSVSVSSLKFNTDTDTAHKLINTNKMRQKG